MTKYAVRRECHFNCNGQGAIGGAECEPIFIDTSKPEAIVKALQEEKSCCELQEGKVFPATTKVSVYELEGEDEGGTEFFLETLTIPSFLITSGRFYDPKRAAEFAEDAHSDCVECFNKDEEIVNNVTPTGIYDSYIGGDLYVQVRCNSCGHIGETGDGEYWQDHDMISHLLKYELPKQKVTFRRDGFWYDLWDDNDGNFAYVKSNIAPELMQELENKFTEEHPPAEGDDDYESYFNEFFAWVRKQHEDAYFEVVNRPYDSIGINRR